MLAATRWRPLTSWLFLPCDLPLFTGESVRWLLDSRKPGVWAILPRLPEAPGIEPLLAYYDFRAATLLENASRPAELAMEDHVVTPVIPKHLQEFWKNVNTPEDLAAICRTDIVADSSTTKRRSK